MHLVMKSVQMVIRLCKVKVWVLYGVVSAGEYMSCVNCKVKVEALSEVMGMCNKHTIKVKLNSCELSTAACVVICAVGGPSVK
jgi:hypothetical protein